MRQPWNMLFMSVAEAVFRAGAFINEVQPLNMFAVFVTDAAFSAGTLSSDVQDRNMLDMLVAALVLNCGTVSSALQLMNILAKLVTPEVQDVPTTLPRARAWLKRLETLVRLLFPTYSNCCNTRGARTPPRAREVSEAPAILMSSQFVA